MSNPCQGSYSFSAVNSPRIPPGMWLSAVKIHCYSGIPKLTRYNRCSLKNTWIILLTWLINRQFKMVLFSISIFHCAHMHFWLNLCFTWDLLYEQVIWRICLAWNPLTNFPLKFWHRIVKIFIAHSEVPLNSQSCPEGELKKIIFTGEMEITQSAGNLKALDSPEVFFLFLGNRSQISLWLIGLKLTDKPGK